MAIRYDIEPLLVELGSGGMFGDSEAPMPASVQATMKSDFEAIRGMGFDTVWLDHFDGTGARTLLKLSAAEGLALLWPCREVQQYLRTQRLPPGCGQLQELAGVARACLPVSGQIAGLGILDLGDDSRANFAETLRIIAKSDSVRCVAGSSRTVEPQTGVSGRLAVIRVGEGVGGEAERPMEDWLGQYHRGLLAGLTDGVLLDRFRGVTSGADGLVSRQRQMTPRRAAALSVLLGRVRKWSPILAGTTRRGVAHDARQSVRVRQAVLVRGTRRFLLVVNPDDTHYARGAVTVAGPLSGRNVRRVVEVGTGVDRPAGRVVDAVQGQVRLQVDLRPGGAVLYEVF